MRLFTSNQRVISLTRCSGRDGSLQFKAKVDPSGTGENSEFVDMDITTNGDNVSDNPGDILRCLMLILYASLLQKLKHYPSQLNFLLGSSARMIRVL